VPLTKGMGDAEFAQFLDHIVYPLACAYEPDIIIVSCGFDLYRHDRLAGLNGTPEGYAILTRRLCRMADTVCGGRIAFIMEGGYSVKGIRECGQKVIGELCGLSTVASGRMEKLATPSNASFPALEKSIAVHGKYWPILRK